MEWLAEHVLQLAMTVSAVIWTAVKLGEWKARREDANKPLDTLPASATPTTASVSTTIELVREQLRREMDEASRKAMNGAIDVLSVKLAEFGARMERANAESSRLTGIVQELIRRVDRLPEDFRSRFMPLDRAEDMIEDVRRSSDAIWAAIETLRRPWDGHTERRKDSGSRHA